MVKNISTLSSMSYLMCHIPLSLGNLANEYSFNLNSFSKLMSISIIINIKIFFKTFIRFQFLLQFFSHYFDECYFWGERCARISHMTVIKFYIENWLCSIGVDYSFLFDFVFLKISKYSCKFS